MYCKNHSQLMAENIYRQEKGDRMSDQEKTREQVHYFVASYTDL